MAERLLVSVPEAAALTGLGATTIKSLLYSGELGSLRVGRRRLIPVSAIAVFIAGRVKVEAAELRT